MRKRIILFRHGKSDWQANFQTDHERPLSKRGEKAARTMGNYLLRIDSVPEYALTSSALRARMTLELAAATGWDTRSEVSDALYAATPDNVLQEIQGIAPAYTTAILVGHNPTWSELTSLLLGGGEFDLSTAAMVCVDFEVDTWLEVSYGEGALVWLQRPKMIEKLLAASA